jgi:hypothetical protein
MTKQYRIPLRIGTFFTTFQSEGQVVADLIESDWRELYMFPLFLGNERYKPKPENLHPQAMTADTLVVPCDDPQPLRPMPVKVGQVTGFFMSASDGPYMEFEATSDEVDFDNQNWEAHVEFTPRLNNPRDCVTRVRLSQLGGGDEVHGLHRDMMEGQDEPA